MTEKTSLQKITWALAAFATAGLLASGAIASPERSQGDTQSLECDGEKKKDKESFLSTFECDGEKKKDKESSLSTLECDGEKKKDKESSLSTFECDGEKKKDKESLL